MLYLAGDNSLSDECIWALKEICRVGLKDGVNVLAQYDSRVAPIMRYDLREIIEKEQPKKEAANEAKTYAQASDSHCIKRDGDRFLFKHGEKLVRPPHQGASRAPRAGEGDAPEEGIEEGMAFASTLRDFVQWAVGKYSEGRYMLVLCGHGSGAEGDVLIKDENPVRYLSIRRLRWALEDAQNTTNRKIDILGMDACAMSTIEVAYELRNTADFLVAAEGFESNTGWPYQRVIDILNRPEDIEPRQLASEIVRQYAGYYTDYAVAGISVDLAACDLKEIGNLANVALDLGGALKDEMSKFNYQAEDAAAQDAIVENAILLAHWRAQSYRFEDYVDLWDFCSLLAKSLKDTEVERICKRTMTAIEKCVLKSCYSGPDFQHSHGLSIHFPWTGGISPRYRGLHFSTEREIDRKETATFFENRKKQEAPEDEKSWIKFLEYYLEKTRRKNRNDANKLSAELQRIGVSVELAGLEDDARITSQYDKGECGRPARIKNPPAGFYIDDCE
jgi:cysteine peptidase C11 family protein